MTTILDNVNFALPKPKTNFMKKSFGYWGALAWNNLSSEIKNLDFVNIFKRKIKRLSNI